MKQKLFELMEARRLNKKVYFNGHLVAQEFAGTLNGNMIKVSFSENPTEKIWVDIMELEVKDA